MDRRLALLLALALGLVRDRRAVPLLIALLDHDHDQVRSAAIDALGIIGEYLARMHFRAMQRPTYAVRETTDSPSST